MKSVSFVRAGLYVAAAVSLFSSSAMATSIGIGQANIAGTVIVTGTTVSFFNTADTIAHIFDTGVGTGSFAGLAMPDTIKDLTGGPVTGAVSVVDFATFTTTAGVVHFNLTNIDPGFGTLAACANDNVGNICTPAGSPFTIEQVTANHVAFTLSVEGIAYLGLSTAGSSIAGGLFTGQQVPGTISGVLAAVRSANGFNNTYSATFNATAPSAVPEPGTLVMFLTGVGMLGISIFTRRRQAQR